MQAVYANFTLTIQFDETWCCILDIVTLYPNLFIYRLILFVYVYAYHSYSLHAVYSSYFCTTYICIFIDHAETEI